jgi:hypothetical protein
VDRLTAFYFTASSAVHAVSNFYNFSAVGGNYQLD